MRSTITGTENNPGAYLTKKERILVHITDRLDNRYITTNNMMIKEVRTNNGYRINFIRCKRNLNERERGERERGERERVYLLNLNLYMVTKEIFKIEQTV